MTRGWENKCGGNEGGGHEGRGHEGVGHKGGTFLKGWTEGRRTRGRTDFLIILGIVI